jgi:adenine-specific DNA-methyltransferase
MPKKKQNKPDSIPLEQYTHKGKKRVNNPPVGLVTPETDVDASKKTYAYDPHLDPSLQWAGKAENTSFEVPTVSLHVHERIDPRTIIEAVCKVEPEDQPTQGSLFAMMEENPPLRDALQFYKHSHNWSNRLIAGDSLLVMNSLLEKEGMAGQVQMIYIDPPYGIEYSSNFQPFINNRTVKERDSDLTQEPETIKAFRDTWSLEIHSYLSFLRDRLKLALELLHSSGSVFVQIGEDNLHLVRTILDEIMLPKNFVAQIIFRKKMMPLSKKPGCESMVDYILWYAKSKSEAEKKIHQLFRSQVIEGDTSWSNVELPNGTRRELTTEEIANHKLLPKGSRVYQTISMKPREYRENQDFNFEFEGKVYPPPGGRIEDTPDGIHCWSTTLQGMERLAQKRRVQVDGNSLRYVLFHDDYPVMRLTGLWNDTAPAKDMKYVVETSPLVVQRCILMATEPGELVLDITCGSGTTAYVAEQWGRRWITCDTSRVSVTLARQRLMTSLFDYYEMAQPQEGVGSGFKYKTVPHVTLGSVANNEPPAQETLYNQPIKDTSKWRVTGPFTVEAVPALTVQSFSEIEGEGVTEEADASVVRSGETLRQSEWRDELLRTGIRGRHGERIIFSRVEPLSGTRWLHADAETMPTDEMQAQRAVISFGPQHQPLEQRQVQFALDDMRKLQPRPSIIIFAAFQFDPEASKDIDEMIWPGVTLLKAQMNADLLTDDLKKKRASNESFWLIGQPDVELKRIAPEGTGATHTVEILGFDYYNTVDGTIESGGTEKVAMWMLDTDYDGRSIYPRQVFFPLAGDKEGWAKLAKNLKAEIDPELIEAYRGTKSLPFTPGSKIAVKIVDDRGIESIRVMDVF